MANTKTTNSASVTLFSLGGEWEALAELIYELEGDITGQEEAFETLMAELEAQSERKMDGCAYAIKAFSNEAKALKDEADRLTKRAKRCEKIAESIHDKLEFFFTKNKWEEKKTTNFSFKIQKNPPSVVVTNPDLLPERFWVVKKELSKTKIKDYFKEHNVDSLENEEETTLAYLEQTKSLRIR